MMVGILDAPKSYLSDFQRGLKACGMEALDIKKASDLDNIKGVIICGTRRIEKGWGGNRLLIRLGEKAAAGMPIFAIQQGLLPIVSSIEGYLQQKLQLLDIMVKVDATGNVPKKGQISLYVPALGSRLVKASFKDSPSIVNIQPNVGIMCMLGSSIVMVRQGNFLGCVFFPDLSQDTRLINYFIGMVNDAMFYT